MDRLPADVLAIVLGRLPPRSLAACRCVCRGWRSAVEGRCSHLLLPRSLHGIFINYDYEGERCRLFSRPPATAADGDALPVIDSTMGFVPKNPWDWRSHRTRLIKDHCNGLLIYDDGDRSVYYVCNPATWRWAALPAPEPVDYGRAGYLEIDEVLCLAFDPAVSLQYDVVRLRGLPGSDHYGGKKMSRKARRRAADAEARRVLMEWPPPVLEVDVFSSATGRWEERKFARQGDAVVVTVADIMPDKLWPKRICDGPRRLYSEYWEGELSISMFVVTFC